jgi:hypothetical protein
MAAQKEWQIFRLEVSRDEEGKEDTAHLRRGYDDGDVVTHCCLSEQCLRIFLSQKLSPSIRGKTMQRMLR